MKHPKSFNPVKTSSEPKKQLIYAPNAFDLKTFESLAAGAAEAGFTHIDISGLSERTDWRGEDKDSPWCEWSVGAASIFKHVTPKGLEEAYPADFVRRQFDYLRAKHRIVKKLGLRASYSAIEPQWLSERVYRQHPEWRGSRADNSLRSVGMFFAPNTDHPEVREAYRAGVEMLLKECPLIETFSFHTNDAGAFMPWAKRNFLLPNGPTGTSGRDMGERVVGWLSSLRQGALDAGVDAWFFIDCRYWFNDDEAHCILKSLKPGIGIHGMALGEQVRDHSLIGCGQWNGGYFNEVIVPEYPTPWSVVEGVRAIKTSPVRRLTTGGMTRDFFPVFKAAMAMPAATTEKLKLEVLRKMAETRYAADVVDDAVDAWYLMERAETMMGISGVNPRNHIAMLRWLVRPLVPHQELLTDDEKNYWLPYIYQSRDSQPDAWMDYVNHSGYRIVNNWEEAARVCCAIDRIEATLLQAAETLRAAANKTSSSTAREKLTADSYRVRALRCLTLTTRHTLQMGTLIYLRDAALKKIAARGEPMASTNPDDYPSLPKGNYGDNGLFFMYRTMRWELDNINELIKLMKESPVPIIYSCPNEKWVGSLVMGGNIAEQLQKKVDIMLKYWRTAEIGFYRPTLGG